MKTVEELLFVGINSRVQALDRRNGVVVWERSFTKFFVWNLFVNICLDGNDLFVQTGSRIYCLDPLSGKIRWETPIKGFGTGIATFATVNFPGMNPAPIAQNVRNDSNNSST